MTPPPPPMAMAALTISILLIFSLLSTAECGGVNYGRIANNLPSATRVVRLLKSQGIDRVKVYDSDPAVLKALSGSGIKVTINLPNELLSAAALLRSLLGPEERRRLPPPVRRQRGLCRQTKHHPLPHPGEVQPRRRHQGVVPHGPQRPPELLPIVRRLVPTRPGFQAHARVPPQNRILPHDQRLPLLRLRIQRRRHSALFRQNAGVVDAGNGLRYFDAQIFAANLTVFLFALFNESKKFGPTSERNFGKVYDIPLTAEGLKGFKNTQIFSS